MDRPMDRQILKHCIAVITKQRVDRQMGERTSTTFNAAYLLVQELVALKKELQILEKLSHPRIVQYYGYQSNDDGSLAIFVEFMPGVSFLLILINIYCRYLYFEVQCT